MDIIPMPELKTGHCSGYHLMNDYEVDDRNSWIELKINDEKVTLYPEDLFIRKG